MCGSHPGDPLDFGDEMTLDLKRSLTNEEKETCIYAWTMGCELVYEIEDLLRGGDLSQYSPVTRALITNAVGDRQTTAEALQGAHPQTNTSSFHSQQHAEKMLKAVLVHGERLPEQELKKLGHRIGGLVDRCRANATCFAELANDAACLDRLSMGVRYTTHVAPREAIEYYFAALRVGGLCAGRISGRARRLGTARRDSIGRVVVSGVSSGPSTRGSRAKTSL